MKKKLAILLSFILIIGLSAIGVRSREKAYAKEAQMQRLLRKKIHLQ